MTAAPVLAASLDIIPPHIAEQMLRMQARFDAVRPPCPAFCDGSCETDGHFGDAVMHISDAVLVPCESSRTGDPNGSIQITAQRHDMLDQPSEECVNLNLDEAGNTIPTDAMLTAQQAYDLGAALMAAARKLSGELAVPVPDVKIGDWIEVDGEWMQVFFVLADEAANNVQICVTADPGEWSDFDYRDENPEHFTLTDTVRIRRANPAGGIR